MAGPLPALVSVSGYLIGSQAVGAVPLPPAAEHIWWYQFYFATDRGGPGTTSTGASSASHLAARLAEMGF